MSTVRTRYAPSPTGIPHIGNIRTALFNYLFAKKENGEFILRIEDTDQKRSTKEHILSIRESLDALGLKRDKEFIQSERLDIYQKQLQTLKEKKLAFQDHGSWRFKVDTATSQIQWIDLVHNQVSFPTNVIEDFVIIKSDGFPTYHMASVVDDHFMEITHVMRGDEWISSTPKHLLLYKAFDWTPPSFAHLPPILGPNKKKLSKREGAKSVLLYLKEGYLPEALTNYLALLGWAPLPSEVLSEGGKREREIFSLNELIKIFSLERLNKNSPIFNIEKLKWFNGQWIRKLSKIEYIDRIIKFYPNYNSNVTAAVASLTQDRVSTLQDYQRIANFFYEPPQKTPPVPVSAGTISQIETAFKNTPKWEASTIKEAIDNTATNENVDRVDLISGIRNIISGSTVTPPLYESLQKLGKKETIERLENFVKKAR